MDEGDQMLEDDGLVSDKAIKISEKICIYNT